MVGSLPTSMEWETNSVTSPPVDYHDGCVPAGLGGPLQRRKDGGKVDHRGKLKSYKPLGIVSFVSSVEGICKEPAELSYKASARQYDSNCLHQAQRGYSRRQPVQTCSPNVEMVQGQEDRAHSTSCTREGQSGSGLSVQGICRQIGMDARPTNILPNMQEIGVSSHSGFVCIPDKPSTASICGLEGRSRGYSDRCILDCMDERTKLCVSALLSLDTSAKEVAGGQRRGSGGRSNMDDSSLVPNVSSNGHSTTTITTSRTADINTATFESGPSVNRDTTFSGLACLRQHYASKGFSQEVADVMVDSCRGATHRQYQSAWKKWSGWCNQRNISPVSAPLSFILDFLVEYEKQGRSYRTISVYRSAISRYHEPINNCTIGQNADVCCLMKGFFNRNPPKPKYLVTWEIEPVLSFLLSLPDWESLSLKMLTLKMVLLLNLVTIGRVSSLVHIDISRLNISENSLKFIPSKLAKQSRPNYNIRWVVIEAFEDKRLCPVTAVTRYLECTRVIRGTENQLLVSYLKPHKKVVSSTVSRWICDMLSQAGVDTQQFKAHSTRGAAASASQRLGKLKLS
ncbi:uncharacterized protein LOC117101084 [Anneissia japonica]|uniref:uncharacterized protein LOC117101084 n=1 Tax=Anneissia japonica TaxID=1529436 RepID=UPI001425AA8B|nr:uncharacterized protein LOC117101084 [Anneissia japonica]